MLTTYARRARTGALAAALVLSGGAASAQDLTLLGGSAGGTWDALSGTVKGILERSVDGASVRVRPGAALSNIQGVTTGKADLGWMLADSSNNAIAGRAPFEEPASNLCNIAAFHPTIVHLLTTAADVKEIADFEGKRVGSLPRGSGSEATLRNILELEGMSEDQMQRDYAAQGDLPNMMKDGHIDVWLQLSGVPGGAVADLMASSDTARFMDLSDELVGKLREMNGAWNREVIEAGTYPGQDEDVQTAGFLTHIGTNCDTMAEEDAYAITKALIENYEDLGSVNNAISKLDVEDLARDIGVPLHPGARRAYEEAGAL